MGSEMCIRDSCNPPLTPPRSTVLGIELGPCMCEYTNFIEKKLKIPVSYRVMKLDACTLSCGDDGIILYITIDNTTYPIVFPANECSQVYLDINEFGDGKLHEIKFAADKYGVCNDEVIYLREMRLLKTVSGVKIIHKDDIHFDLIKEVSKWVSENDFCPASMPSNLILTDVCFCKYSAKATRRVKIVKPFLSVKACSLDAGGDGVIGIVKVGNKTFRSYIPSNECKRIIVDVRDFLNTIQNISLSADLHGKCLNEIIIWNNLRFVDESSFET